MTQRSSILSFLEKHGHITNGDIADMNREWVFTGRNRITDEQSRLYFAGKGLNVSRCKIGKTFSENRLELQPISADGKDQAAKSTPPDVRTTEARETVLNERTCGGESLQEVRPPSAVKFKQIELFGRAAA